MTRSPTPLGAIVRGAAAGLIGTALMTGAQRVASDVQRRGDEGADGGGPQQQPTEPDPCEQAPMPAKVARRIIEGVFHHDVPPERIPLLTHAMHWAYGIGWGSVYGVLRGSYGGRAFPQGLAFGTGVWRCRTSSSCPWASMRRPGDTRRRSSPWT